MTRKAKPAQRLTDKMEHYCINRATGHSKLMSYRMAYDAGNMSDNACNVAAWRLERKEQVRARLEELERQAAKETNYTLAKHVQELARLADAAEANGNYGAATQCRVSMGKACGLYTDNISIKAEELSPSALLSQIQMTDPATAKLLAAQLGLSLDDNDNTRH